MAKVYPVDVVTDELRSVGVPYVLEQSKHVRIKFTVNGHKLMYVVPTTPGDRRTVLNCRAGIRRLLLASGVQPSTR